MTKIEMAQRIVQVLYNLPKLPEPNHPEVKREARASLKGVTYRYELGKKVAQQELAAHAANIRYPAPSEWEVSPTTRL